jgi:hypothetical protein
LLRGTLEVAETFSDGESGSPKNAQQSSSNTDQRGFAEGVGSPSRRQNFL